jgi:hypothetical protein
MHNEKVLGMSHQGFFLLGTQKESIFWEFFRMLIFKNISNANLLEFFK